MSVPLLECSRQITPLISDGELKLKATAFEVGGVAPTDIISEDQKWYVEVEWELSGSLKNHLCGNWHLALGLESIGRGDEYRFHSETASIPMDPCGDGKYSYRIEVDAGEVKAEKPAGTLYIIAVKLGSTDACGNPGRIFGNCRSETELHFVPASAP